MASLSERIANFSLRVTQYLGNVVFAEPLNALPEPSARQLDQYATQFRQEAAYRRVLLTEQRLRNADPEFMNELKSRIALCKTNQQNIINTFVADAKMDINKHSDYIVGCFIEVENAEVEKAISQCREGILQKRVAERERSNPIEDFARRLSGMMDEIQDRVEQKQWLRRSPITEKLSRIKQELAANTGNNCIVTP